MEGVRLRFSSSSAKAPVTVKSREAATAAVPAAKRANTSRRVRSMVGALQALIMDSGDARAIRSRRSRRKSRRRERMHGERMETAGAGSKRGEETTLPEPDAAESALVARARAGERVALEEIVRLHAGTVYRIVAGYVPRDEAEDATQEVFVRIQQGLPAFEGRSRLATWIHRIATNVGLRRIRTRRRK